MLEALSIACASANDPSRTFIVGVRPVTCTVEELLMAYSDKRSRVLGCLILVALAVAVLALAEVWLFGGPYTTALPRAFNSERWRAADAWSDTRCSMIADLQYRVGVVGKTRAELNRLLGQAEYEDDGSTSSHWHLCPSFTDIYILEVRWHGDRAVSAQVRDT